MENIYPNPSQVSPGIDGIDGDRGFRVQQKNRKGSGKHLKSEPILQGLWKRKNDARNHSRFSPNGDGEKGKANARFRVFYAVSKNPFRNRKIKQSILDADIMGAISIGSKSEFTMKEV